MSDAAVIYEVTLEVQPGIIEQFDTWLTGHIQDMLKLPGFEKADMLPAPDAVVAPADGWVTRVVQYTVASQADLDAYFRDHAARMRAEGIERFSEKFRASRMVLPVSAALPKAPAPSAALHCLNCGTLLIGKYCVECGQPNHTYVAPLWETVEEFFGNHFGFDTKFFHSIVPLLFRPGFLTREYCAGRRERYIKPLRLYLFSSILFFFCAAWLTPAHFGTDSKAHPVTTTADRAKARKQLEDSIARIKSSPGMSDAEKSVLEATMQSQLETLKDTTETVAPVVGRSVKSDAAGGMNIDTGNSAFAQKLTAKIRKIKEDPQGFENDLIYHAVPKLMFVFLPLVALLLKLFYIRRKHLYMEHLIFTLHCHALFFLALLVGVIISALTTHYGWPVAIKETASSIITWYLVIYLFLALRNFYQQSWFKTLVKFSLMTVGYFILAIFGFIGAFAVAFMEL